jgi:threonine dehydratase
VIPYEWFEQARQRVAPHILATPLTLDRQREIYLKWENHQVTGSFKARGALNKVLSLEDWERAAGLVAASAGNHGQGVALAGHLTGASVEVYVPKHAVPSKVDAMRRLGAKVHFVDGNYPEAEAAGRSYAREQHRQFVSPYNDGQVIAGQSTLALEILDQLAGSTGWRSEQGMQALPEIANWIVPTGGGGLISACGAVMARLPRAPALVGVQPVASAFAYSLFHRHTQEGVEDDPTLADGLSGAIENDSVTIPMLERYVNDLVLVSEGAIERAIAFAWEQYQEKIEGSAAVGLAAVLEGLVKARPCVVIITGGNIEADVFDKIIARHAVQPWS